MPFLTLYSVASVGYFSKSVRGFYLTPYASRFTNHAAKPLCQVENGVPCQSIIFEKAKTLLGSPFKKIEKRYIIMLDLSEYKNNLNSVFSFLRLSYEKVFDDLYDNFDIDLLFESNNDILDVSKVGEYLFVFFVLSLSDIFSKAYVDYLKNSNGSVLR